MSYNRTKAGIREDFVGAGIRGQNASGVADVTHHAGMPVEKTNISKSGPSATRKTRQSGKTKLGRWHIRKV